VDRLQAELAVFQQQGDVASGGGLRAKDKLTNNLDLLSTELRDEMNIRSELNEGWAFTRAKVMGGGILLILIE
jgi:hypothetical protein